MAANAAFLYAAVEDLQGSVRAIDLKAEVVLIALTVPLSDTSGIATHIASLVTDEHFLVRIISIAAAVVMVLGWVGALIATFRVLVASHNPSDAIPNHAPAKGAFFAGHLFKFKPSDLLRDKIVTCSRSLGDHIATLPVDDETVIAELAFEQLKLAFICSRKIAMFNFAVRLMTTGIYAAILLLVLRIWT